MWSNGYTYLYMEKRTALFAGSFDPFTRGHEALVGEALRLFDRVVIGIGHNIGKQGLLSVEERKRLIEDLYRHDERVEVVIYNSLTADLARKVGATALVRGLRNTIDFEQERILAAANRRLSKELVTVTLFTPSELSDISSSMVRELLAFGHEVDGLLPEGVKLSNYMNNNK